MLNERPCEEIQRGIDSYCSLLRLQDISHRHRTYVNHRLPGFTASDQEISTCVHGSGAYYQLRLEFRSVLA